jgi:hypothetical protein
MIKAITDRALDALATPITLAHVVGFYLGWTLGAYLFA